MIWWRKEGSHLRMGMNLALTKKALYVALVWPSWYGEVRKSLWIRVPFRDWHFSVVRHDVHLIQDFFASTLSVMVTWEEYEDFVKGQREAEGLSKDWLAKELMRRNCLEFKE